MSHTSMPDKRPASEAHRPEHAHTMLPNALSTRSAIRARTALRTPLARLAPLAAALWLAGCSQMPVYERPTAPVAQQWPASAGSATGASATPAQAAADLAWEGYFADPTLRQLIDTALAHNRDLRVAVLNIEQARAQLGLKQADLLPTVNGTVTGSRTPTASGGIASTYTGGLLVTAYEIDFFGRVASLKEQALAQYLATQAGSQSARISLIATVANTWLALLADSELLSLTEQTLTTREASLKLIRLRHEHGVASELDVRLAESLTEAARATLAQQQRQRALDENALTLLLGQPLTPTLRAQWTDTGWLRSACRNCPQARHQTCWPAAPTSARPNSNWWRPTPTSARHARRFSPKSRSPQALARPAASCRACSKTVPGVSRWHRNC
jgi:hypothetical protein